MRFRTELSKLESKYKINHNSKILSLGSCFAENIGEKLTSRLFDIKVNPFGIAYNNISLSKILKHCVDKKTFHVNDLVFNEISNLFFHYDFHSNVSDRSSEVVVNRINKRINETNQVIREVDLIIITMGTSFAYKHNADVVANCHKMPTKIFKKSMLSIEDQIDSVSSILTSIKQENPKVNVLLTVSPIRHIKEGLVDNTLSKSMLRVVCDKLVNAYDHVSYFPAYEIMLDDLRDYRFYQRDLIHPNEMALTYIWNKFEETYFDSETIALNSVIDKLNKLKEHRILNPDKEVIAKHNQKIFNLIEKIKRDNPSLKDRF